MQAVALDGTLFQKSGIISGGASDMRARAKRWDEKVQEYYVYHVCCSNILSQQVDSLRRKRDRYLEEIKEVTARRRKEPELQTMASQINGLETRLRYSKKDRDTTVRMGNSKIVIRFCFSISLSAH